MTDIADLKRLRTTRVGVVVEDHPYDLGYWARYNGEPRPTEKERREGWDDCDAELKAERSDAARCGWDTRLNRHPRGGSDA